VLHYRAWAMVALMTGVLLTACTPASRMKDQLVLAFAGCAEAPRDEVDWAAARNVEIRIRRDEFQPMVVGLAKDVPYVLHIRNVDRNSHAFRAPTFFRQAAVAKISVDGESNSHDGRCITGVSVPPGGAVAIHLMALLEGRYEFTDPSWFTLSLSQDGDAFGTILVD
jgi:hypothetical protein